MIDERQMRIERDHLEREVIERELVARLTPSKVIRLKNLDHAGLLRSRIAELDRRIAQLKRDDLGE